MHREGRSGGPRAEAEETLLTLVSMVVSAAQTDHLGLPAVGKLGIGCPVLAPGTDI